MMIGKLREHRRLGMGIFLALLCISVIIFSLASLLSRPDLRYRRGPYSVFKDHAVTSCIVENHGQGSSKKALLAVRFLSKILDIRISPESARNLIDVKSDQLGALIELKNIGPGDAVTVSFSLERAQDKPFEVSLLDVTQERSSKEQGFAVE